MSFAGDDSDEFVDEGMDENGEVNNFHNIFAIDNSADRKRANITALLSNRN